MARVTTTAANPELPESLQRRRARRRLARLNEFASLWHQIDARKLLCFTSRPALR
jgi:hypothetical protein